jgi:hypothetical protein
MNQTQVEIVLQEIIDDINSEKNEKAVLERLLNLVQSLADENAQLTKTVQQLNDEINRLKGEQGKPEFTSSKKEGDISSEEERKNAEGRKPKSKNEPRNRNPKQSKIKIDRYEICRVDKKELPEDIVFKGYKDYVVQDIIIKTENIKYSREVYYSPSKKKYYYGKLPIEVKGEFGPGIRTLIPVLKSECNMSEPKIKDFLENFDIEISKAYISSLWTDKQEIFHQEKDEIYCAGLETGSYQQIDDTSGKVNGVNHYVQIVCNEDYSAYFTTAKKDRLSIIDVLTNFAPRGFLCNQEALELLEQIKFPKKLIDVVLQNVEQNEIYFEQKINELLDKVINLGPQQRGKILDACAIAAYHKQTDHPIIPILLSDDAPQFKLLTQEHALCWIHDGRHYKKLNPIVPKFREKLEQFRGQYWDYYAELFNYKKEPSSIEAKRLRLKFDRLFSTKTGYAQLDNRISKTKAKKDELLVVLSHPELPLHNNAAELAARSQARSRDVSLQTKSEAGTKAKDTFLTITQIEAKVFARKNFCIDAKKLGVRVYEYVYDRVSGANEQPSLAQLIRQKNKTKTPALPCGP